MSFRGDDENLPGQSAEQIRRKFLAWNGDGIAPKISHWTAEGRVTIRAASPMLSTEVLLNDNRIGFDVIWVDLVLRNFIEKKYDGDFGFAVSEKIPHDLQDWNDL